MCKKSLLFVLLMAMFAPWAANAQTEIVIGTGGTTTSSLPVYALYENSYSQQLFTAEEIGMAGSITSISFFPTTASNYDRVVDIYMLNVDRTAFASNSEWEAVTASDLVVADATIPKSIINDWVTIELSTPFNYDGTSTLLVAVNDHTGSWNGKSFSADADMTGKGIYIYQDGTAYDPTTIASGGYVLNVRNNIKLDITSSSGGPTCDRPESLVVSDITGYGATCTWESNVGNYTFEYKKAADSDWRVVDGLTANTYTLSDLEPMTAYNTRVKAVCDAGLESSYRTANFTTKEVCPDGKICIGEGTATSTYLPTYNYYNYSLTEQIYTAEEIGQAGAIESVDIFSVGTVTRTLEFYMVSTEKETFTDGTDWIAATASNLVYNGSVTFAANSWNTIEFDNPFIYDGHSNVALIVRDMTGSYVSSINFYVFDAPSQAIRIYRDGGAYDLANPGEGTVMDVKNRVRLVVGEPPACPKPMGLTVNYTGGTEATISWTSDATAWNMRVNGTEINGTITNPYTLTGLELSTTYEVEVQANCGDATSEWVGPVSFTTDACMPEDQISVNYELTDSYGDGWNGNYILVVDESCNIVEMLTIESGNSASGALRVCGSYVQFLWYAGNYPGETSWVFTDNAGNVLFEGAGSADMATLDVLYTIDNNPYSAPADVAASEVGPRSATLSWTETGTATAWQILLTAGDDEEGTIIDANSNPFVITGLTPETEYFAQVRAIGANGTSIWTCLGADFTTEVACPKPSDLSVIPYPFTADVTWNGFAEAYDIEWAQPVESTSSAWLQYDDGTMASNVGNSTARTWTWGVMYPAEMLEGNTLTKIAFYEVGNSYYTDGTVTLNVYSGGDTAPETLIGTKTFATEGTNGMREVVIDPIEIDASQNLWITLTTNATYCMAMSAEDGGANSRWFLNGSNWVDFGTLYTTGAAYSYMIRGFIETTNYSAWNWSSESGITSPYTITGLEAETDYAVRVKAVCGGEDGESLWTWAYFTTPTACDMPIDLVAEDITHNSAKLNWTGYQESYNLRYRHTVPSEEPATIILEAHDVWGDGTGYQMLLDADATAFGVEIPQSGPYTGTDYSAFEYLIPENADCDSNTENIVFDGSVTLEIPAGVYDWCIVNPYPGGTMYIAGNGDVPCRNNDYVFEAGVTYHFTMQKFGTGDGAALVIDRPMSDWTTVNNITEVPYTLTGLTPVTYYEWQIQGVNADCGELGWSEIVTFTPPENVYAVATVVNPTEGGMVTGAGAYCLGDNCTLMATPNPGYHFINWTEDNEVVSSDAEYVFTVTGDRNLVANFSMNHWIAEDYQNSMFMIGVVQIDGVEQASPALELGAFCNGECRGTEFPEYEEGRWVYFMNIVGNNGDEITFRLYDHSQQQEMNLYCFNVLPFETYGLIGIDAPYEVLFAGMRNVSADVNLEGAGTVTGTGEYLYGTDVTLTAMANPGYAFNNWTLEGEVVSTEPTYTFTLTGSVVVTANFNVVQTQQLVQGYNWFSTFVEISLDDLKAALVAALPGTTISINSQSDGSTTYNGARWRGSLNSLDLSQMYMINVTADCVVTVEGLPIDPSEHVATIHPNFNWMAFPLRQGMTLTNAFAGFVVNGDMVISQSNGSSTYFNQWRGGLNTFEPGKGYMYKSNVQGDRTFTFPVNAK